MGKERAAIMVCDNPKCGKWAVTSKEEPAEGYYLGKGMWHNGGGGYIPATYACSFDCIMPAVAHNIKEAQR